MAKKKVNRRKDGLVEKKVKVPDGKGGFKRKSVYNRDPVELDIEVTEIKDQVNKNLFIPENKLTLEQVGNRWYNALPTTREDTTKEGYKVYLDHAIRLRGKKEIQTFLPVDIQEMYNEFMNEKTKKGEDRSINTLKHLHFVVNTIFKFAIKNKLLRENPCADMGKDIKPDEFEPYVYNESEYIELLRKVMGTEEEVISVLGGGVGLRAGEICGLQLIDINRDENQIKVNRSRFRVKGKVGNKKPKSKNSLRVVDVDEYIISVIDKYIAQRKVESEYVLCRSTGKPYTNAEISGKFHDVLLKYNLPKTRLHDLRHFCATQYARLGVDIKTAAEQLGDDPQTILKVYQHVLGDMKKKAAAKIGTIFNEFKEPSVVKSVVNEKSDAEIITTEQPPNTILN